MAPANLFNPAYHEKLTKVLNILKSNIQTNRNDINAINKKIDETKKEIAEIIFEKIQRNVSQKKLNIKTKTRTGGIKKHRSKKHRSKKHRSKKHRSKKHRSKKHRSKKHRSKKHKSKKHKSKKHKSKKHKY